MSSPLTKNMVQEFALCIGIYSKIRGFPIKIQEIGFHTLGAEESLHSI